MDRQTSTKNMKQKWRCPKCDNEVILYFNAIYPPQCTKHTNQPTDMEKIP